MITGASQGFGLGLTRRLLNQGHEIYAWVRGGASRLAPELVQNPKLHLIDADLAKPETFERVKEAWTGTALDALVNNAGYGILFPFSRLSDREVRDQMEVNFFGTLAVTRLALPALQKSKGVIVNLSSIAGRLSLPNYSVYSASKFALEGWSEGLRYELKPKGVDLYLVEPGGFKTSFNRRALSEIAKNEHQDADTERFKAFMARKSAQLGQDPLIVIKKIESLILNRPRRFRHLVGKDAKSITWLRALLPYAWIETLIAFVFSRV